MGTRKIAELRQEQTCMHPEHEPPKFMVYSPGVWEHVCPACGKKVTFTVYPIQ